jgi:hypothetical protein
VKAEKSKLQVSALMDQDFTRKKIDGCFFQKSNVLLSLDANDAKMMTVALES